MGVVTALCIAVSTVAVGSDAQAPAEVAIREALVINTGGRGGRTAIPTDPVVAAIVQGTWQEPREDAVVSTPAGERRWKRVRAGEDGSLRDPALRGGYAHVSVECESDRVMMLDASGHTMVYVNGEPRVGDPYGYGFVKLPVALRKGKNAFLFQVGRGELRAKLTTPKGEVFMDTADATLPDVVKGGSPLGSVVVVNASDRWLRAFHLRVKLGDAEELENPSILTIPPYSIGKPVFRLPELQEYKAGPIPLSIELRLEPAGPAVDTANIMLNVVAPEETHKRTFLSQIDGSIQYYGVVPQAPDPDAPADRKPGILLTLHGAGVEGIGQARVYAPKKGIYVIAPTNRRSYGFDWEDWGRQDAIEVLNDATRTFQTDPERVWLTGHSMGGHGTWHLGVTYPDRFAAIAPSAGWVSMFSYASTRRRETADPIEQLLQRCTNASDTLALLQNLKDTGVYVLHGDADDNVPVAQARTMRKALAEFHPDFAYYERPGAGHWWGNECCDWPPLVDFLTRHALPKRGDVRQVDYRTADPGNEGGSRYWAEIRAQKKRFDWSEIHLKCDPEQRRVEGTTLNVETLWVCLDNLKPGGALQVRLDGQDVVGLPEVAEECVQVWLHHDGDQWKRIEEPPPSDKAHGASGPFRGVIGNAVIFVVGTHGSDEENSWALAKARYDAETFWYRGNGAIDVIPDTRFDEAIAIQPDMNIVLFGHKQMNSAWEKLLAKSPMEVDRGVMVVGGRRLESSELGCLMIRPRPTETSGRVGVVAGAGMPGMRALDRLPYFSSGVNYPDWIVIGADAWENGVMGVRAAGFFANEWGLESGESVIRDAGE